MSEVLLEIEALDAFYGDFQALFGVSLRVAAGEVLALIGANGAGKSTLLNAIAGVNSVRGEAIRWRGEPIGGLPSHGIVGKGIALVPEGRRLFPSLSVEENLVLGGDIGRAGPWSLAAVYELFPILEEKRSAPSTSLSGGQQQMVAIGRALMANPDLILLDELSLGLAPIVIRDIYAALPKVVAGGMSAILVEQDVTRALAVARQVVCLQEGRVSLAGRPDALTREQISIAYFGA